MTGIKIKGLTGPKGEDFSIAWSPDGTKLAVGSSSGIEIWSMNGIRIDTLKHTRLIFKVAWDFTGTKLAAGSGDDVIIWDTVKDETTILIGHTDMVRSVDWSPDGKKLVSGSQDKSIIMWDVNGTIIDILTGHKSYVLSVDWSPDGTKIISGSQDNKTIIIWDVNGTDINTLGGHPGFIYVVAWSPNGTIFASGAENVEIWDLNGTKIKSFLGDTGALSLAWNPDGTRLISGSFDDIARIWDLNGNIINTFTKHTSIVNRVAWSPDGTKVISASFFEIKMWDPITSEELDFNKEISTPSTSTVTSIIIDTSKSRDKSIDMRDFTFIGIIIILIGSLIAIALILRKRKSKPTKEKSIIHPLPQDQSKNQLGPDVFISFSSQDKTLAEELYNQLTETGVKAWISTLDVLPGQQYTEQILNAIDRSRFMILLMSKNSLKSRHVNAEVERGFSNETIIIPIRIDETELPRSFEYYLSTSQWKEVHDQDSDKWIPEIVNFIEQEVAKYSHESDTPNITNGYSSTQTEPNRGKSNKL